MTSHRAITDHAHHERRSTGLSMTQGKIERGNRSTKNILSLVNYNPSEDLKAQIEVFIENYNNQRYHESLNYVNPVGVYTCQALKIFEKRDRIKKRTLKLRKQNSKRLLPGHKLRFKFQLELSELIEDVHIRR